MTIIEPIFDPFSQTQCTAFYGRPCRYRYGFTHGASASSPQVSLCPSNPTSCQDIIPASQFSAVALQLQSMLPKNIGTSATNNYISPNFTSLNNWSTTDRIDFNFTSKDTLTFLGAIGRQASAVPQGQTTSGRNIGPVPYNWGQAFAPKTAVGMIEETHIFNSHLVNQFKYGYARYNGPTIQPNQAPPYAASNWITGLPAGQAAGAFPIVTFSGTNAPTNWSGQSANITIAQNYTLLDNAQWTFRKHSFTFGGQIAWMLYNVTPNTGGSSALTIANSVNETAGFQNSSSIAIAANTGHSYASFLVGQIDRGTLTQNLYQAYGSRFRAMSPYVQDNWKVTPRLTLDLGLRYDFFPSVREVHDTMSFFVPTLANPVTGVNGALQFAGTGANTCNCHTLVHNYYENIGPRIGLAYQVDPKTVIRTSYGVMYTHGNGVGGGAGVAGSATNTLGFSASPAFTANSSFLTTFPLTGNNNAFPAYAPPVGRGAGPAFGTGFTTTTGYTGTPQNVAYFDSYLGGRAPQYINWSFGFQHQWTEALSSNITYVGSQGHFLIADAGNARGYWANQLDPKYLAYNTSTTNNLSLSGAQATAFCQAHQLPCPANFASNQSLATALRPFPFQGVSDFLGNVANSNYHALQTQLNMRASHGITFMVNYTWSRSIDNGGTFRSGYDIPAAFSGSGKAWKQGRIERSVSTSNQPHHLVVTGVWEMPFGKTVFAGNAWSRAILGGFKLSEIFQAYSGSPLAITSSVCGFNPAQNSVGSVPACQHTTRPSLDRRASMANGGTVSRQPTSIPLTLLLLSPRPTNSSMSGPSSHRQTTSSAIRHGRPPTISTAPATISWTSVSYAASRYTSPNPPG